MNLRPLGDRIVCRPHQAPEKIGNVIIADSAQKRPQKADVLAVGPGRTLEAGNHAPVLVAPDVKVGDVVVFAKYGGTEIEVDGETLLVLSVGEILAVEEPPAF